MVSKNNRQILKQSGAKQTPHYGLRKLSIGVASVLLSTTLYMGATTVYADTVYADNSSESDSHQTLQAEQPATGVSKESLPTTAATTAENSVVEKTVGHVYDLQSSAQANKPKGPTEETAQNQNVTTESGSFQYTVHYVDADTKKALAPDTVYTHHYTRTDVDDQMGDWQYKSGDYTVTGTPTETDVDKVTFTRDQTADNKQFDYAKWGIKPAQIDGYTAKYGYNAITDMLPKEILHGVIVDPNEKTEVTFEYTKKQLSLFVDYKDDDEPSNYNDGFSRQGYMGDKVNLDPQLPAGYELAPNQPTTYTFGSTDGYLTLHLKHKIAEHSALVSLNANVGQAIIGVGYNDFIEVVPEGTELPGSDRWDEYNGTPVANLGEQLVTVKVDEVFHLVVGVVGPSTMTIPELSKDVPTVEALLNGKAIDYDHYGVGIKELLGRFVKPSATENGKEIQLEFSQELDDPNLDRLVPHKVVVDSQGNPHLVFGGVADLNHLLVHSEDSDKITLTFAVGLSYIPVYKDVKQRVIEITKPDGKVQTVKQVATLRADLDQRFYDHQENTHRTVGEWSTGTWEAYTPEEIPGYTPTIKSVDAQTVTEATKDQTVKITYTANPESVKVNYVDDDNNGSVVKTATLNGATDQTVKTNISIPHNYVLKGTAPSEYTFKAGDNADITVHLKHATQDVSDTDPQAKIEREYSIVQKIPQINHDVNGKVTYTTKTLLNDWHFVRQRTATKDLVTGEINYGQWLGFGPGVFESPEFGIDKIDYTKLTSPIGASEQLLMWRVGESTSESYKKFIDYLGLDPDQFVALVGMADFDGNNGKNEADREQFNEGLKLGAGNFESGNDNDYNFKGMIWKAGSSHNHLYLNPSYKDYDKSFDLFYEIGLNDASYDFYNEVLPKSQTIELISQPVDLPVTINYKDTATGEIVGTDSLTTNYYQDFLLPDHTPAGYVAVDPSVFKNARSVRAAGDQLTTTFEIPVHHKMVTVTPDHPKTPNDKLPDNPTKSYPSGVAEADLNKTLTRTIKVTTPDGKTTTISQVAKLTRTAEVDEVTGEVVKYSDWTTGTWGAFTPKEVEGYTPTPEVVAQQAVTADMGDQTVVVTYTADAQTIEVRYVDDDDHEKLVHTNTVAGKTDQTVTITPAAPAGYELVDATPITYQVTAQPNQVVTVHVKHQTSTTSESKTLTRTIELHTPFDGVKLIKQVAELTRLVTFDKATGQSTTGAWSTGTWEAYTPAGISGYTPTIKSVDAQTVTEATKDQTVKITYTANPESVKVNYVDDDDHEKLVHTNTVAGKTDQTVTITPAAPAGYELVDATPITYQVTAQPNQVVTVHVKHQTSTTSESKTLTRTIELHTPFDGVKLIKQVAELTRLVTFDKATGQSTTGAWSTGTWDAYQVPTYAGYASTIDVVPAVNLTGAATDQTVVVNYQALQHTTHVNYVDENGTLVHTTTLSGKTNEVVTVPNEVPSGWQLVAGQTLPSELTFTATGYPDTTVTIAHRVITVTAAQPQPNGTKLPDNPNLTFNGVENADLNRTVTRQIVINLPGQAPQTITQTVHLTRNATVDEVTGQVTYGAWTSGKWAAVTVPTVAGYTPSQSEVPAVTVTATTTSQVITINYQVIPAVPTKVTPTKPQAKVAATGKPVVASRAAAPTQPTSATEQRLPQTGNQSTATGQIWGLLAASLATGLGLWHTKKKKQKG